MHHLSAVAGIEVQKRFGIRRCSELDSFGLQLRAQFRVVVDLAIEYNDETTVFANHRLRRAIRQIEDRQTAMGQTATAVCTPPGPRPIWSPRPHGFAGGQELRLLRSTSSCLIRKDAVQST